MRCQNCGVNQVTFRYSSNINGCVTETHLCAECAAMQGYNSGMSGLFGGFFPSFGGQRQVQMQTPMFAMYPFVAPPQAAQSGCGCGECSCETPAPAVTAPVSAPSVDDEMKKRRELNAIREQMRIAAENEDFEKAVELREQIKELEQ